VRPSLATVVTVPAALKDSVDHTVVAELARRFSAVDGGFDAEGFTQRTSPQLDGLELKARMELIARELWRALGERDPSASMACVVDVARAEPPVVGWAAWPLATVIEVFGLSCPSAALDAMEHVTKRMSCEFAVRPLLRDHFDETYARLLAFTGHEDERVRRLPSEGMRPRLPWGVERAAPARRPDCPAWPSSHQPPPRPVRDGASLGGQPPQRRREGAPAAGRGHARRVGR
jgi:hypothetical protein